MLLKHTFVPTKIEESISTKERFYQELYRRHYHLFNDLAWGSANLLCNYNVIVALSAPVASWLTSGFLVFDVCLLIVSHHFAEQEYLLKKEQYLNEKGNFDFLLEQGLLADEGRIKYDTHRTLLDEQLMQLELGWQKTNATDWFSVAAAAILLSGFTAAFLFTASAAVVVSFLICSIAIGMYLSASDYGQYQQKSFILQGNQDSKEALSEMQTARQDLMRAMFKNTIMPLFATTAFALCWPAALALTVMYFAYEPTRALFKGKPAKPSEIPSPPFSQADNDEAVVDVAHERSSAVCCH